jgi:hypothetical protein
VALDLHELQEYPLRLGLSCEAIVDTRQVGHGIVPTTTLGSPLYKTNVFKEEEKGDFERIASIISANIDPRLNSYAANAIVLPNVDIRLLPLLEEAASEDEAFHNMIVQ